MFHEKVKETRLARNMTQKQLADAARIAVGSVSAYENGGKRPPVDAAGRIAAALGVSLDWLLNDDTLEDLPFSIDCSRRDLARALATIAASRIVLSIDIDTDDEELDHFVQQANALKSLCLKGSVDESVLITWLDGKVRKVKGYII
jgi:transcriptional regulator with XRE-family HTH domain